jgi:hypothetical protein
MASSIQLRADAQRSLAFGSIGAGYTAIGTPFAFAMRIMLMQNLTDATLQFSFTGNTDHFVLAPSSSVLFDVASDQVQTLGFYIQAGTRMFVKQIGAPTTGSVYLSVFYGV